MTQLSKNSVIEIFLIYIYIYIYIYEVILFAFLRMKEMESLLSL